MGGICYKRYNERGLFFEIKCIEDVIAGKRKRKIDANFEKKLLEFYKKYSEVDYSQQEDAPALSVLYVANQFEGVF